MARKKDLAGLAALGALGYALSRGKGGSDADAMDAMTRGEYGGPNAGGDIMTDKEPGWDSGTAPAAAAAPAATRARPRPSPAATRPMGGSGRGGQGGATAEELAAYAASKKKPQYQSLQDRARAYEEERAASGVGGMYGTRKAERREPLPTAEDMAYKKGGSVKASSASRRADGIATKGKTRGKIY